MDTTVDTTLDTTNWTPQLGHHKSDTTESIPHLKLAPGGGTPQWMDTTGGQLTTRNWHQGGGQVPFSCWCLLKCHGGVCSCALVVSAQVPRWCLLKCFGGVCSSPLVVSVLPECGVRPRPSSPPPDRTTPDLHRNLHSRDMCTILPSTAQVLLRRLAESVMQIPIVNLCNIRPLNT